MQNSQRAREEVYKSELAADQADVRSAALITDGRPLIPAVLILYKHHVSPDLPAI